MEKSNKNIYIIVGVVLAVLAVPAVIILLSVIFYYYMGATR